MATAFSPMRDAGAPPPQVWLVDPNGYPRRMPDAGNIGNGHTERDSDGGIILRKKDRAAGWRLLEEVITPEEMAVWVDYHAQSDAAGGRIEPLPEEKWPKGIVNPRAAARGSGAIPKAKYEPGGSRKPSTPPPQHVTAGAPAEAGATTRRSQRG